MVTVFVGEEKKRFILHQNAVCARSKFFKAACSNRWREGQERVVQLPEVEVTTFQSYCHWIYSDDLPEYTCTMDSDTRDKNLEQKLTIKLYLLGDTLDDVELRNKTTSRLFASMRSLEMLPTPANMKLIYESTPSGSLLRKMLVDAWISRADRSYFTEHVEQNPAELVQEIAADALSAVHVSQWDKVVGQFSQYMEVEQPECITIE